MKSNKLVMYSGRRAGRNIYLHEWFKEMIPTLKKGWKMGIPVEGGIAIFEFKGINKPKPPLIFFDDAEDLTPKDKRGVIRDET